MTKEQQLHYRIIVHGKVQGVFFRASAQKKAEELGISGFAMNQDDGSVFIEAEGKEAQLAEFFEWCHKGSEAADVQRVEVQIAELQNYSGFSVKR